MQPAKQKVEAVCRTTRAHVDQTVEPMNTIGKALVGSREWMRREPIGGLVSTPLSIVYRKVSSAKHETPSTWPPGINILYIKTHRLSIAGVPSAVPGDECRRQSRGATGHEGTVSLMFP